MVIGITGGVGSGKTLALSLLEHYFQAHCLAADEIGREQMEPGMDAYNQIQAWFGEDIMCREEGGSLVIDRRRLAEIVFQDRQKLQELNAIIHPLVKKRILARIQEIREEYGYDSLIVIEAALLLEDHYETVCDEIWYIHAEDEARRRWLLEQRGYSEEKMESIFQNQLSQEEYRERCWRTIENHGGEAELIWELEQALLAAREGQEGD
jgi:dephospho-CoA kinase